MWSFTVVSLLTLQVGAPDTIDVFLFQSDYSDLVGVERWTLYDDMLMTELSRGGRVRVFGRSELTLLVEAAAEFERAAACKSEACLDGLEGLRDVRFYLSVQLAFDRSGWNLSMKLYDRRQSAVVWQHVAPLGGDLTDFSDEIDGLGKLLSSKLGYIQEEEVQAITAAAEASKPTYLPVSTILLTVAAVGLFAASAAFYAEAASQYSASQRVGGQHAVGPGVLSQTLSHVFLGGGIAALAGAATTWVIFGPLFFEPPAATHESAGVALGVGARVAF